MFALRNFYEFRNIVYCDLTAECIAEQFQQMKTFKTTKLCFPYYLYNKQQVEQKQYQVENTLSKKYHKHKRGTMRNGYVDNGCQFQDLA